MPTIIEGDLTSDGAPFGIVVSRFNEFITEQLKDGALDTLRRHGVDMDEVDVIYCPGSFEIPLVAERLASRGDYDAIICIGAVIRGETPHFEQVVSQVTSGIGRVALDTKTPVLFGVITTDTIKQAIERAGTKAGNKGAEAAESALEMVNLMDKLS